MNEAMRLVGTDSSSRESAGIWISLEDAASRSGKSLGHLGRQCRDVWQSKGLAKLDRPPAGGKSCWYVREEADAAFATVKFPEQIPFDLRTLTEDQRRQLLSRKRILDNWLIARAGGVKLGFTEEQISEQFLNRLEMEEDNGISRATLYNWHAAFRMEGLAGLIDRRWQKAGTAGIDDPFLDAAKSYYLTPRSLSKRVCWEMACLKAHEQGWPIKGYRSACIFLEKIPAAIVRKIRDGEDAFIAKSEPSIERDYTTLHTNEQWVGDHHQFDVIVDFNGEFVRPWLTAWMDMRSRRIVGFVICAHDPNQNSILSALRAGCLDHGVPEMLYVDNGKDFDSYTFHGRTKWERLRGKVQIDENHVRGILAHLDVKARFCWAYHGQSKPIERWFNTVEDRFGKPWLTCCGNKPENRPDDCYRHIDHGEAPKLADFTDAFKDWVDRDYHARAHGGDGMNGQTPVQVFDSCWNGFSKRTTSESMLDLLLMKQTRPSKVGKNGVAFMGLRYGQFSPELIPLAGKEVYLRVDERCINQVQVWSLDDRFICIAPANAKVPANATEQQLRESISAKKSHTRAVKAYHHVRPRMAEDLADTMTRAAAKSHADAAASADPFLPPDAPNSKPLRSRIEDQLPAVQRAKNNLRGTVAAGGESIPMRFIYSASDESAQDELPMPSMRQLMESRGASEEDE